jgi:IS1 family transposase
VPERIERSTKLILNFALGRRSKATTDVFIEGFRHATSSQNFQITTDGFAPHVKASSDTLADRVDFAQLIKVYRSPQEGQAPYSSAEVASVDVVRVLGNPDPARICTSIVERQNLTIRMQMRRLTRLTNGFSKKWERTLRVSPAMESGIADHVWKLSELLASVDYLRTGIRIVSNRLASGRTGRGGPNPEVASRGRLERRSYPVGVRLGQDQ